MSKLREKIADIVEQLLPTDECIGSPEETADKILALEIGGVVNVEECPHRVKQGPKDRHPGEPYCGKGGYHKESCQKYTGGCFTERPVILLDLIEKKKIW